MAGRWLVAPPGTRLDEPGWREPWPGLTLRWGINGERPPLAVQRDGVLVATGLPFPPWPQPAGPDEAGAAILRGIAAA